MAIKWFDTNASFEVIQNNGQGFRLIPEPGAQPGTFRGLAQMQAQSGVVSGAVDGDRIAFTIRWGDGKVGAYNGYLFPDGRLRGATDRIDAPRPVPNMDLLDEFWNGMTILFGHHRPAPAEKGVGWWSKDGYHWAH